MRHIIFSLIELFHIMNAKSPYKTISSYVQSSIPVFIPTFNNPTYLKNIIDQFHSKNISNIIVIDNNSTYPPMVELLQELSIHGITVIFQNTNNGPRYILEDISVYNRLPDIFCLTDPDIIFNAKIPDDFILQLADLTEKYKVFKAGFALDTSKLSSPDVRVKNPNYFLKWEQQFWQNLIGKTSVDDEIYSASIDTTFAVYNKKYLICKNRNKWYDKILMRPRIEKRRILDAVRVAGCYTCQHIPWTEIDIVPEAEKDYYKKLQTWSNSML